MKFESRQGLCDSGAPGDWCFPEDMSGIYIKMPDPQRTVAFWPFCDEDDDHPCWGWDGSIDAPTLHPSLHLANVWHGWMKYGKLISV